jgi:hypothetical protein
MKCKALILAWCLVLLPTVAGAQQLAWRDGYIDWRGKAFKPDWRAFMADDGTHFVVDMKSIAPVGNSMRVFAYLVGGDEFDLNRLISFTFDCEGRAVDIASKVSLDQLRAPTKQARELACH